MDDKYFSEIEAREHAAAPGPWIPDCCGDENSSHEIHLAKRGPGYSVATVGTWNNAEFIAHARTDMPALIAALRKARNELAGKIDQQNGKRMLKPEIVCLCGSTRFYDAFQKANYELTMQGKIVLSIGFYSHSSEQAHGQTVTCTPEQEIMLDELQRRKIDLADNILVLNVGGYIGESTRKEIAYAIDNQKPVQYLEPFPSLLPTPAPTCEH